MKVEELKMEVERVLGAKTQDGRICLQLVDELLHLDLAHGDMLTYTSFQKMVDAPCIDKPLVQAVLFLTSSRCALLVPHGQLIDEDGAEFELEDVAFQHMLRTGELTHPHTGELVPDAASKVMPYFALVIPDCLEQDVS